MAMKMLLSFVCAITIALCAAQSSEENYFDDAVPMADSPRLMSALWANEAQFPFQVAITSESPAGLTLCSGTVIASIWVLTSAGCVLGSQEYRLRFNSVTHYTGGAQQVSTESYIHPYYNPSDRTNDVALIRIPTTVSQLTPVRLLSPKIQFNLNSRLIWVAGWGRTKSNEVSPVLQYAHGRILKSDSPKCQNEAITNSSAVLCAEVFNPNANVCAGDFGSPLVVQENRTFIQIGVAVFDPSEDVCRNSTSFYTSIASVADWITSIVGSSIF